MTLTPSQLLAFLPTVPEPAAWAAALNPACERFAITAPVRLAAFLGQIAHESSGFKRLSENLNYTTPERIRAVWPSRFPTVESAEPYVRQPEKLANKVYANRLGNGDEASGDGWKYRGRGLIMTTGRANYRDAGHALELLLEADPDSVQLPERAALTAGHFWHARELNQLADLNTTPAFDQISRRISGGTHGLVERRALWARAKAALT